jgi:ATP-dependent DNA helicase RecQ
MLLLEYFGQEKTKECGHCDYCKNKEKTFTSEVRNTLQNKLLNLLQTSPLNPEELYAKIPDDSNFISITIRLLLDEEIIRYNDMGNLEIFTDK